MPRLKVLLIGEGMHPSERLVGIVGADGQIVTVEVHHSVLDQDETMDIGWPVGEDGDRLLVDLSRECSTGASRVWVPRNLVVEGR